MAYEGTFVLASKMKGAGTRHDPGSTSKGRWGRGVNHQPELCQASPEPVFRIRRTSFVQDHPDQYAHRVRPSGFEPETCGEDSEEAHDQEELG